MVVWIVFWQEMRKAGSKEIRQFCATVVAGCFSPLLLPVGSWKCVQFLFFRPDHPVFYLVVPRQRLVLRVFACMSVTQSIWESWGRFGDNTLRW